VLAVAVALTLAGCKPKQDDGAEERVCDRESYIAQSWEFKPGDGEGIRTVKSEKPVVEGYFGKPYNKDWLTAVGRASILETVEFIESTGARVYHASPISPKSALNLASLPDMPWDIEREWKRADRPVSGSSCGFLTGLYLPKGIRGISTLRNQSAIVTRADAGRWTLVHEFMHHNFKSQAALRGYDDDVTQATRIMLLNSVDSLKREYAKYDKRDKVRNKEYTQKMAALFLQLIDIVDTMVVQYQFEEVTIEATLQDQYEKGELGYVPVGSYQNAGWYIDHSSRNVGEVYKAMTGIYDELSFLAITNELFSIRFKLDRYVTTRDERLDQMNAVIARRQSAASRLGELSHDAVDASFEGYAPCGRGESISADVNRIAEAMRDALAR